jgi:Tfp pilus assembly protein PilF
MQQIRILSVVVSIVLSGIMTLPVRVHASPQAKSATPPRSNASALVEEGAAALEKGDTTLAVQRFRQALRIDANNVTARTYLGLIADRSGDLEEAEREFGAAAKSAPNSPEARNNYGAILLKRGRRDEAAHQFETSLRLNPKQPGALVNLAQIHFEAGSEQDLRLARALFKRALAITPDAESARAMVVIALRLKEPEAAKTAYADYSRLAASGSSADATQHRELGAALFEEKLYSEAQTEFALALSAEPRDTKTSVLLARAYRADSKLDAAERVLNDALKSGGQDAAVYAELAEIFELGGHAEKAIPAMRRATELDQHNEAYHFRYAMMLTDTDAPQAAVIRLNEAFKMFPNSAPLWFAMGIAQFQDNKNEDARRAFQKSLELNPKLWGSFAYLGMIEADSGQASQAIEDYKRALAIEDASPVTHYLLAEAYGKLTPPDESDTESHLKRAMELEPGLTQAHLALGKLYGRQQRLDEAATQLELVMKADPKLAEAYYQLGRVYVRQKRQKEGEDLLARFQQLSAEQKQQSEAARRDVLRRLADVRF